jgi:protein SCO1/2
MLPRALTTPAAWVTCVLALLILTALPALAQDTAVGEGGAVHDHPSAAMNGSAPAHEGHAMPVLPAGEAGHDMDGMPPDHDHAKVMEAAEQAEAQGAEPVGIKEKLGNIIADATFLDADGVSVNLRKLTATVPTIFLPIYYRCPDVCNLLQGSFARILPDVKLAPGKEFQVVSVSFDPRENTADAARAKKTYLAATGSFPSEDWKFLTGDQQAIDAFLGSIGYTVRREGGIFAHPVAVVAVAPGGKVVRYLYGSTFLPFDITMAGTEAAQGKTGLSVKRMLSFCYNYDPQGRRYVFDILRVSGFAIAGFVGLFIAYLVLSGRKDRKKKDS